MNDLIKIKDSEPQDDSLHSGYMPLSWRLHWPDLGSDIAEIHLYTNLIKGQHFWGERPPESGVRIDALPLLAALTERWTLIGRPWLSHNEPDPFAIFVLTDCPTTVSVVRAGDLVKSVSFGFAEMIGRSDIKDLRITITDGNEIKLSDEHASRAYGSESLMIVEALKALGNTLAEKLWKSDYLDVRRGNRRREVTTAWFNARDKVAVWPFEITDSHENVVNVNGRAELAFYADLLGVDMTLLLRGAVWTEAKRLVTVFEAQRDGREVAEELYALKPIAAPDDAEIDAMVANAEALPWPDAKNLWNDVQHELCLMARAMLYYHDWPELPRWTNKH